MPARVEFFSLLVALVWTVHPVHNAAVAYISGRADSLAALFALSAWLLLLQALDAGHLWKRATFGGLAAERRCDALHQIGRLAHARLP